MDNQLYSSHYFKFINQDDALAELINKEANQLYRNIAGLDMSSLDFDDFGNHYFATHHTGRRLFFSIKSSADIIYQSVKRSERQVDELSFMDYGAGLGTLFLLAGSVGFRQVYFNDYFPEWARYAQALCEKLNIPVTDYITGDIDHVIAYGQTNHVRFDIIASRNVIEHIYDLKKFYSTIFQSGLTGICFSTTTANYHNPAMRVKHYLYHYKVEKKYFRTQRRTYINELEPGIAAADQEKLVALTRGRAFTDFTDTVDAYLQKKQILPVEFLRTNTCDCRTGVWAERLLTRKEYTQIVEGAGFEISYTPGFWDTRYKMGLLNLFTKCLNFIIGKTGIKGYYLSPFVNVIACRNNNG